MSPLIKAVESQRAAEGLPLEWRDLNAHTELLAQARAEADRIIAQAHVEANQIRRQAAIDGREEASHAASQAAQETLMRQVSTLLPALQSAAGRIIEAQQAWLRHWEQAAIQVSVAIAARVVRREVKNQPQITGELIREALELAAGSTHVQLRLHPHDHAALGGQAIELANQLSRLGAVEVVADSDIEPGGCRVDTRFGMIDQQFAEQLKRIEVELM